uniref:nuclear transport factor 2 family protein n=1 Tax=Roseivirga sp. TaxID=1964215 RepID=UPI004047C92F
MRLRTVFCVLVFFMTILVAKAQTENEDIKKTIMTLFDGMRKGDSTMVHSAFAKDAIMQTIANNREGQVQVQSGKLADFLKAVGTPHTEVWDERIEFGDIKIDGPMASVWTPYQFFRGESFSHCGVNSFQLYKGEKGWKIIYLVDTRRRDDCK